MKFNPNTMNAKETSAIVQKVWTYAHVLKDDGLAFMDYTEQITFLLFLKMAHERELLGLENDFARLRMGVQLH